MARFSLEEIAESEGWGSKSNRYWFFGLEPGGEWAMSWTPKREPFSTEDKETGQVIKTPTWQIAAKIVAALEGTNWQSEWRAVWGELHEHVYWDNIQPLPRPTFGSFKGQFKERVLSLGPSYQDEKSYLDALLPLRIAHLRAELSKYHPKIVFCFGKSFWEEYRAVFDVSEVEFKGDRIKTVIRGETKLVFLPFLSYRFINDKKISIAAIRTAALDC